MINPLNIAVSSAAQLLGIYFFTFIVVLVVAALMLMFGKRALHRRGWAKRHPVQSVLLVLVAWCATLYGGGKGGTNQPPVTPPVAIEIRIRIIYDAEGNRFIPREIPLLQVVP